MPVNADSVIAAIAVTVVAAYFFLIWRSHGEILARRCYKLVVAMCGSRAATLATASHVYGA